ncbi:MAG: DNRLRE domain-containing protein [Dehalococcoidia bacterium]|nr:DNRLRE domain-containing protein [Dehalococcoidia bacterium]
MGTLTGDTPRGPFENSSGRVARRRPQHRLPVAALLLSCLLLTATMGSMPAGSITERPLGANPSVTAPTDPQSDSCQSAPLTEYEVEVACQKAVFVDETNPSTNNNGALQGDYLRVGTGPEFCGQLWTLLDIGPIAEADGGPLPDGASITEAQVKIRKESGLSGTVKVYGLMDGFNEGSATWNTRPNRYNSPTASTSVSSANGWTYLDIPEFALNDAIAYHHGLRLALCPTWTDCSRSIAFYSDEHSYHPSLVISYLGAAPEPTPPPPTPVEDTVPCDLDIHWSPAHPAPGQMVTITATATDDVEMRYVAIYRGSRELARRDASSGQTELSVSYTEEAVLPSLGYLVAAKDRSATTSQVIQSVTIPVVGTGTAPEVNVDIEWEIDEVIPERYRLIREDGQVATITATATDPEGIDYLDIHVSGLGEQHFDFDGENSVSETVYWVNDNPSATTFSCRASAVDLEGNYTSTDGEYIDIVNPGGLLLMSTAAPGFHNPSNSRLSWERMVQTFGVGECYWLPEEWKSPYALIWYHAAFKSIADNGECFGMSTLCNEIYQNRVTANAVEPSASAASYMSYDNSYTKEWVEARQGGQLGEEVAFTRYHQRYVSTSDKLNSIEADLYNDVPGVMGIYESGGHAVVPWMSRHMPDGTTRIYIYDCNREGGIISTRDGGTDNPAFDFNNRNHYPYVEFDGSSWSYLWGDGTTWNDELNYFSYEEACGDMGQENEIAGPWGPHLTDHDIPSVWQYLFAPIGGDVDLVIEDEEGNMTGIYKGEVVEDIPESMAMYPMMGGPFTEHELYVLPIDKTMRIRISGNGDDEYVFGLLGGGSLFAVEQKHLSAGAEDFFTLEPWGDAIGHKMRVKPSQTDTTFNLILAHMFEGYVAATDSDFIGREYVMEIAPTLGDIDFSVFVEEGGDSLVVENNGEDDLEFDATMRSTESLDEVEGDLEDLPFIPGSTVEDVRVGGGETVELTPEDWRTTEESGSLHVLRNGKESTPQGSSFPLVPVLIGVAAAAIVLGILAWKGVIGKGRSG